MPALKIKEERGEDATELDVEQITANPAYHSVTWSLRVPLFQVQHGEEDDAYEEIK